MTLNMKIHDLDKQLGFAPAEPPDDNLDSLDKHINEFDTFIKKIYKEGYSLNLVAACLLLQRIRERNNLEGK